jgi:hypothetical protein
MRAVHEAMCRPQPLWRGSFGQAAGSALIRVIIAGSARGLAAVSARAAIPLPPVRTFEGPLRLAPVFPPSPIIRWYIGCGRRIIIGLVCHGHLPPV